MWWKTKVADEIKRSLFAVRHRYIHSVMLCLCSFHRYLSFVHMFFILNYWKHNRMNVYMMFPAISLRPFRPPVQQGRIIDIWLWTITNSRPEKEQINIFDRIFKLTIINVDMFKFPFDLSISYMRYGRFFTFSKTINIRINLKLCKRQCERISPISYR